jgi:hypothetical protein
MGKKAKGVKKQLSDAERERRRENFAKAKAARWAKPQE